MPLSPVDYDIVVLGAGAAGLMAARVLASAGARVAVLEARARVGGRILTEHVPDRQARMSRDIPVELGAEFVHGLPAISWNLFREGGMSLREREGVPLRLVDGVLQEGARGSDAWDCIARMQDWFDARPTDTDLSFAQYLAQSNEQEATKRAALAYVEGFNAADAARISVAALVAQQRAEDAIAGDRIFHLTAGYDTLPRYLARRLQEAGGELRCGCVVEQVEWGPRQVRCRGVGSDGAAFRVTSSQAIITLPLGVLQAGSVQFAPLPDRALRSAARLAMGPAMRFTLVFREPFWQAAARPLGFLFAPGMTPPTWWTAAPEPWPILTGWLGGPRVEVARRSWLQEGLATLATAFNMPLSHVQRLLLSSHCHDWLADRFSLGAYSYVPAGALDASWQLAAPVEQTLFFAGEHADPGAEWGTVHGALRSGMRAAMQVLQSPASERS